jgi:superfamily II DNA/RNA helicase
VKSKFKDLGVPESLVQVLSDRGIDDPFEIQRATIPDALAGLDICGRAPTGSGKTIAFGVPLVVRAPKGYSKEPTSLILAPTRELAEQITTEIRPFARMMERTVLSVYGGVNMRQQIDRLAKGVDIVVACPGRLNDLLEQRALTLEKVGIVVIDEADRMADMGFLPQVRKLLDQTLSDRQTVLFSATLDGDVAVLTKDYQKNPVRHEVGSNKPDIHSMEHKFWSVNRPDRIPVAVHVVEEYGRTVIFTRTKHGADRAARQLKQMGVSAAAIHGDRSQHQRKRALAAFADGEVQTLVATDVAARGIHVDNVECVLHFDPPEDDKAYLHRSGRTARAGAKGVVICFVDQVQNKIVKQLQRSLGLSISIIRPEGSIDRSTRNLISPDRVSDGPKNRGTSPTRSRSKPKQSSSPRSESRFGDDSGRDRPASDKSRSKPKRSSSPRSESRFGDDSGRDRPASDKSRSKPERSSSPRSESGFSDESSNIQRNGKASYGKRLKRNLKASGKSQKKRNKPEVSVFS